jgi:disulfide bond formation protein DsbB
MMLRATANPLKSSAYRLGGGVLAVAVLVIVTALGFEHLAGYVPCPLCLQERYAYYVAIPALFMALVLLSAQQRAPAAIVFLLVAAVFLVNTGLGTYHAGAEWKFWPGPETCSASGATLNRNAGGLFKDLATVRVIRCDEAAWRMLGLSFAGWNAIASLALALGSIAAAIKALRSIP